MSLVMVLLFVMAFGFLIASALGKLPDWPWGLVILIILLLALYGGGGSVRIG